MNQPPNAAREILAKLSYAAGQYIDCDERPRSATLWAELCLAQSIAAVYLNTGEMR